ncbi:MAG: hypothetical protein K5829_12920 [Treponema sp.]|nr:hypothetical protein [Treponema sp.]
MIHDDPFAANDMSTLLPRVKKSQEENKDNSNQTSNKDDEIVETYGSFVDSDKKTVVPLTPKKAKFSKEGITGFILSLAGLYGAIICFYLTFFFTAFDSSFFKAIGLFFLFIHLGLEIFALCLCNIGAKRAEYRVFCFIGRGVSIFSICWIGFVLLALILMGLGKGSTEVFGRYL